MRDDIEPLANHDAVIEVMVDYKKGLRTLETASKELARLCGFEEGVARALLKPVRRENVIDIRGRYSDNMPEHLKPYVDARRGRKMNKKLEDD